MKSQERSIYQHSATVNSNSLTDGHGLAYSNGFLLKHLDIYL